jgi:hypothetical protein
MEFCCQTHDRNGERCKGKTRFLYALEIGVCDACAREIRQKGGGRYLNELEPFQPAAYRAQIEEGRKRGHVHW